jgi:hypothetical protein
MFEVILFGVHGYAGPTPSADLYYTTDCTGAHISTRKSVAVGKAECTDGKGGTAWKSVYI